jgi:putative hydrolase of HD superfamily
VNAAVQRPESVGDHSFRAAFLALVFSLLQAPGAAPLDTLRLVSMALVHDLAEARVGDITPFCGVPEDDKHAREAAGLDAILAGVPERVATPLRALWDEYEAQETAEARAMRQIDKLDMVLQARDYEDQRRAPAADLDTFYRTARAALHAPSQLPGLDAVVRHTYKGREQL